MRVISPSSRPNPLPPATGSSWLERSLVAASILIITWFYLWTVSPTGLGTFVDRQDAGYYNLLARGLLKGQLSLDLPADPALATMPDPYDPVARGNHGIHDASYYRGKYYIYFGITPVLLLFLPFHVLTGTYLSDHAAVMVFALMGFAMAWLVVRSIIRAHFPATSLALKLGCIWVLGLANMVPPLLRRAAMWEVPIACGYALFMLVLFCVWKALTGTARLRWMAAASLVMGLCIGARPTYLAGAMVLLAPLIQPLAGPDGFSSLRRRGWWISAIAAVVPISLVGVGLALYNHLRFGNPLEFGQTYQMAGADVSKLKVFGIEYLSFNLRVYLFSTAGLSPYFPFLTVINVPPMPPGQFGVEDPYGIIPGMPWVLLSLATVWLALRNRGALGLWCGTTLIGTILVLVTVSCFGGNTGRYEVDFAPGLGVLGAVGAVGMAARFPETGRRWLITILALGLAGWSCLFNVFLSLQHNRLLAINQPGLYARIAHFFNHAPHWLAKVIDHQDGPVEIRLIFPKGKRDKIEPLVVTGHQFLADYLFIHYLEPGLIRFGLEHTSRGTWMGPATRIDPEAEHTLIVQMGSLHPPVAHPAYDRLPPKETDILTQSVKVLLDGRTVLWLMTDCYDASEWQPSIGTSGPHRPGFKEDFSGKILSWKRLPSMPTGFAATGTGKLHLLIRLPPFTRARNEPLLSTGEAGAGDLIYIRYIDATHYQIGHDRWGYGGSMGPVVGYDPAVPLDLDISCPPLLGEGTAPRLTIALNGSPLIDREEPFHPSRPTQIAVGRNLIGASTAEEQFTGVIEIQERVSQ